MLHIVAVGVDQYADSRIPPLQCARRDAEAIYNFFRSNVPDEHCCAHLLVDGSATGANWGAIAYHLTLDIKPGDNVIFYVACRGRRTLRSDGGDSLLLALHDADYDRITETTINLESNTALWVPRLEVAQQVLFLVDTSFAHSVTGRSLEAPGLEIPPAAKPSWWSARHYLDLGQASLITAVNAEQAAFEYPAAGHGIFTAHLLKALAVMGTGAPVADLWRFYCELEPIVYAATSGKQSPTIRHGARRVAAASYALPHYLKVAPPPRLISTSLGSPPKRTPDQANPPRIPSPPPLHGPAYPVANAFPVSSYGPPPVSVPGMLSRQIDLPRRSATLFARIESSLNAGIEPGQEVAFCVSFTPSAAPGVSAPLLVEHPEGRDSVMLHASVSSDSFVPPPGESWSKSFAVPRSLAVSPNQWVFRAVAAGDRPAYSLTVTFLASGFMAGALAFSIERKGSTNRPVTGLPAPLSISMRPGGARLTLRIAQEGRSFRMIMVEDGKEWDEPVPWAMSTDSYFSSLEAAAGYDALRDIGYGLWVDLPAAVRRFLDRPEAAGLPLLIVSNTPVAPFEILTLNPSEEGPLMGIDRPVTRWVDDLEMPETDTLLVDDAACIRPDYPPPDNLPSAAEEERELGELLPSMRRVRRINELESLLNEPGVRLVHFAGHADGNPAKLMLEDGSVSPAKFSPSKDLLRRGRPLLFLNGCRAATGRALTPSQQANMLKMLLTSRCTAAVAPLIRVQSAAALVAAQVFYKAVAGGKSVGEAVKGVRGLAAAGGMKEGFAASYLSYLAYAPPDLRVSIPKGLK